MHFTVYTRFFAALTLTSTVVASPMAASVDISHADEGIMSIEQFKHWLATTDADITFDGDPITPFTPNSALNTHVIYCNRRTQNVCGGSCTVYDGNFKCLNAPDTVCLSATTNVGFCDRSGCSGSCNQYSTCGTRLDYGFCYTPGTSSINVPAT